MRFSTKNTKMQKKVYHLGTCTTSQKIIKGLNLPQLGDFVYQDIKTEKITPDQLEEMRALAGSYEALFSRNALKYREWKLKEQNLGEDEYRDYILQEYTFLKRPTFVIGDRIFIGNSPKNIKAVSEYLEKMGS